jgi:hypothetical protein
LQWSKPSWPKTQGLGWNQIHTEGLSNSHLRCQNENARRLSHLPRNYAHGNRCFDPSGFAGCIRGSTFPNSLRWYLELFNV